MKYTKLAASALCLAMSCTSVLADGYNSGHSHSPNQPLRADGHAPIGVMGDHRHDAGEFMFSYRFMRMGMDGNQIGTSDVTPAQIATTVPNRFFGLPMQPPTLRIVPTEMTMDMHMFGAMYAPNNRVTLMAMVPYVSKTMDHLTFAGPAGAATLGGFRTKTEGIGDVRVSALVGIWEGESGSLHANLGVSLPTGSTSETDDILTPMGMRPTVRLPYPMQLGSGTFDLLPGITYYGRTGNVGYGAQLSGVFRTGNSNGYALGDEIKANIWGSYQPAPWISLSGRIEASTLDHVSGLDPLIRGPVQTADPLNHGGDIVMTYIGANVIIQKGSLRGHRFAVEAGMPVHQDLNGPQMERDWTVTAGWQKAF